MAHEMNREWELEGRTHRTPDDAVAQVMRAKVGAHVAATETYLVQLRAELVKWEAEISAELAKRDADRARRMSEQEEPYLGAHCGEES